MSNHKTFCAFGAYAANIIDPDATVVMPLTNSGDLSNPIDPDKLITLDLGRRINKAAWDEAVLDTLGVDDQGNPKPPAARYSDLEGVNLLTVGPTFPGQHIGGIYLERNKFFADVRPVFDPTKTAWPQPHIRAYEMMSSAVRRQDGSVVRYLGFHAFVVESDGAKKKLSVSVRGQQIAVDIDMSNRDHCDDPVLIAQDIIDPAHPDLHSTALDASSQPEAGGTPIGGAVFIALKLCADKRLRSPKEPIGGGGF